MEFPIYWSIYVSIDEAVRETVFKNHPLSAKIMGYIDSMGTIGITDIQKYKKSVFHSENLFFCVTGNIDDSQFGKGMEALQNIRILQGKQKNVLAYPKCFHCTFLCGISGYGTSDSITESTTDTESDEVAPDKMIVAKTMEDELSELIEPGAVR